MYSVDQGLPLRGSNPGESQTISPPNGSGSGGQEASKYFIDQGPPGCGKPGEALEGICLPPLESGNVGAQLTPRHWTRRDATHGKRTM